MRNHVSHYGSQFCYLGGCGKQRRPATHRVTIGDDIYLMCDVHAKAYGGRWGSVPLGELEPDMEGEHW